MKCPNCGAEANGAFCEYCGSKMAERPINIINNYYGTSQSNNQYSSSPNIVATCPRCGNNNISFHRETTATRGLHRTVGICKSCGNTWITSQDVIRSSKNKVVALVLCILFGLFGGHYFYVGKGGMGILYLFTVGLFGIGWIVDMIRISAGTFTDSSGYPLA